MQWYVLDVNPEPWQVGPVGVRRINGKLSAYVGRSQQLDAYKEAIREALGVQPMLTGKIQLRFFFYRNRAEYVTPTERAHRKHEADLTNLQKATEDALQSVLFVNDRDVNDIHSVMVEQGPDVRGRVVIGIEKSGDMPSAVLEIPTAVSDLMDKLDKNEPIKKREWVISDDLF